MKCQEKIIYFAYGSNKKPRIYVSMGNPADADKWKLIGDSKTSGNITRICHSIGVLLFRLLYLKSIIRSAI